MFSDFKFISLWWLAYLIVGVVTLPLTFLIFKKFWDKGYIFSKTIGLVILTYVIFVLGVYHLVPFTSVALSSLLLLALVADFFYLKSGDNLKVFLDTLKTHWQIFLFEEITFLLILTIWSFVRGFAPDIEGLEKYMDWGFVNSALRTKFMPPADMWFSGEAINYYYFGHLMTAVLTRLSNLDSAITYNLAIASTCAMTFVSGFSLASNLTATLFKKINFAHVIIAGLLSALLLTFGGNLHPVYKIAKIDIQNNGHLVLTKEALDKAASTYWYPDATRFIGFDPDVKDKTIHEFPLYSFVVADLHGHMNDIPLVILFVSFIFAISLGALTTSKILWQLVIPSGFLLSIAYMTNAWDFAVYGLVYGVYYFFYFLLNKNLLQSLRSTFTNGLLIIILWYIFTLPFSLNFTPMTEGLRLSDAHSPFYQLFVLYGGFWLITLPFIIYFLLKSLRGAKQRGNLIPADIFVFSLIIAATILVIIPEIGYIKDIYIYEHRRANTMFKLVYQAFILYTLVSGYIFFRLKKFFPYRLLFALIFVIQLIYPFFAIKSFYGLTTYHGLWGLNSLQTAFPDNYLAIKWINQNITGQPVILEAVGDSYTTFNQVSMATGLPTVEGWIVHEWLWRGGYDKPAARQTDVQKIYEATDTASARSLLQKYNVKLIFVGDKEREKYPQLNEKTFVDLGAKIIFQSGQTRLYQL